ncbi:hypothetical protein Nepgr_022878 [Nepenthes gracilis]|uniref:Uncharacterized protein n=1 Tax=Nepenthes gracilis TaxID=150966 RepID=A0AAD3T3D3_NEPGR|nr:hypothetical protein Nepgr_022878 [Nepenthes gracilis]
MIYLWDYALLRGAPGAWAVEGLISFADYEMDDGLKLGVQCELNLLLLRDAALDLLRRLLAVHSALLLGPNVANLLLIEEECSEALLNCVLLMLVPAEDQAELKGSFLLLIMEWLMSGALALYWLPPDEVLLILVKIEVQ